LVGFLPSVADSYHLSSMIERAGLANPNWFLLLAA